MNKEIEKKYLVKNIPTNLLFEEEKIIHQTYLAIGNEELRIRKTIKNDKEKFSLAIKRGSGLTRDELETKILKSTYEQLFSPINKELLTKEEKTTQQTYLAIGEEELIVSKNVVKGKVKYLLTIKKDEDTTKEKFETEILESTYQQLLSFTNKKPLMKVRKITKVVLDSMEHLAEIDIYQNIKDLVVVEVEFPTETAAHLFQKPSWFGEDVTENKSYKNQSLWKSIQ